MVRKLEMTEASHEMLRSQVSSLDEANATHRENIKSLQTELVEIKEKYNRDVTCLEAEKGALRVKVSDLEVGLELTDREQDAIFDALCEGQGQRGQLRDTVVKQQIRVSRLERPMVDGTPPLRLPNSPQSQMDSDSGLSLPLPDSPTSPFFPTLAPEPNLRANGRLKCLSPTPRAATLRPHPMARGGLVPGRYKASTAETRSEATMSGWFADGD